MDTIDELNDSLNIYYSLIVFSNTCNQRKKERLLQCLRTKDYAVTEVMDVQRMDSLQLRYRTFMINCDLLHELLFIKHNDIYEYNVIHCIDDIAYERVLELLEEKKPSCQENVYITKIYI